MSDPVAVLRAAVLWLLGAVAAVLALVVDAQTSPGAASVPTAAAVVAIDALSRR